MLPNSKDCKLHSAAILEFHTNCFCFRLKYCIKSYLEPTMSIQNMYHALQSITDNMCDHSEWPNTLACLLHCWRVCQSVFCRNISKWPCIYVHWHTRFHLNGHVLVYKNPVLGYLQVCCVKLVLCHWLSCPALKIALQRVKQI